MIFCQNVVIQNENGEGESKNLDGTRNENDKAALTKAKIAFRKFLLQDEEIISIIEKSTISTICEYTYKLVDGSLPHSNVSKAITFILIAAIALGFVVSFMQTEDTFQYSPSSCQAPACDNDLVLCPNEVICQPVPLPIFEQIDNAVIYVFTAEYFIKLFTCWAVNSRDLDIIDVDSDGDIGEAPVYPWHEHYFRYFMQLKNIADLLVFVPYFIILGIHGRSKAVSVFLRVFRIFRVVRIYKGINRLEQARKMLLLVVKTLMKSMDALFVMILFICLAMIFYGSIIYGIEGGSFQVTEEYPRGEFIRKALNGVDDEISPFRSIPTAMYYVVVTCTTVGYGDLAATSRIGRAVACMMSLTAVVLLALPIGIVGSNFTMLYKDYQFEKDFEKHDFATMTEKEMLELFYDIDEDKSQTIDIFELKTAFDLMGLEVNTAQLTKFFHEADLDKSGAISADEFVDFCKRIQNQAVSRTAQLKRQNLDVSLLDIWKYTKAYIYGTEVSKQDGMGPLGASAKGRNSGGPLHSLHTKDIIIEHKSLSQETIATKDASDALTVHRGSASTASSQVTTDTTLGSLMSVHNLLKALNFRPTGNGEGDNEDFGISPGATAFDGDLSGAQSGLRQPAQSMLSQPDSALAKQHQSKAAAADLLLKRAADIRKRKEEATKLCRQLEAEIADIYSEMGKIQN